jgi:hypothetical protein
LSTVAVGENMHALADFLATNKAIESFIAFEIKVRSQTTLASRCLSVLRKLHLEKIYQKQDSNQNKKKEPINISSPSPSTLHASFPPLAHFVSCMWNYL